LHESKPPNPKFRRARRGRLYNSVAGNTPGGDTCPRGELGSASDQFIVKVSSPEGRPCAIASFTQGTSKYGMGGEFEALWPAGHGKLRCVSVSVCKSIPQHGQLRCVSVSAGICTNARIHTHIHTYTHTHTCARTHTHAHTNTHKHTQTYTRTLTLTIHAHTHAHKRTHTLAHTQTHTRAHKHDQVDLNSERVGPIGAGQVLPSVSFVCVTTHTLHEPPYQQYQGVAVL